MARRKGAPIFEAVRYKRARRVCDNGHQGRIGKVTGLCAGCLEEHWAQGGWSADLPSALERIAQENRTPAPPPTKSDEYIVLVCGSREWRDKVAIREELLFRDVDLLIHGGARGADALAGEVARELCIPVREMRAEWDRYRPENPSKKNPAGIIRNRRMILEGPDLVIAFGEGDGTSHMVGLAHEFGVPVVRVGQRKAPAAIATGALG